MTLFLLFADDHLIFCKSYVNSVRCKKEKLAKFPAASTMLTNLDKFTVYTTRANDESHVMIYELLGMSIGHLSSKHLGILLSDKKLTVS